MKIIQICDEMQLAEFWNCSWHVCYNYCYHIHNTHWCRQMMMIYYNIITWFTNMISCTCLSCICSNLCVRICHNLFLLECNPNDRVCSSCISVNYISFLFYNTTRKLAYVICKISLVCKHQCSHSVFQHYSIIFINLFLIFLQLLEIKWLFRIVPHLS